MCLKQPCVVLTGDYREPLFSIRGSEFEAERKFGVIRHDAWPTCRLASIIEFIIQLTRLRVPRSMVDTVQAGRLCGRYRLSRRKQIIAERFDAVPCEEGCTPRYNIAPIMRSRATN